VATAGRQPPRDLRSRLGGLLRRSQWQRKANDRYTFAGRAIDFEKLELRVGERSFPLTLMEANLLRYLISHAGSAVSRKAMLGRITGREPRQIHVEILHGHKVPGGVGEPGVPPVAPAIANALFALTGKRTRELPLLGTPARSA